MCDVMDSDKLLYSVTLCPKLLDAKICFLGGGISSISIHTKLPSLVNQHQVQWLWFMSFRVWLGESVQDE